MQKHKTLTILSTFLLTYWFITKIINIYELHPVYGGIYELTALIALIGTFITPIIVLAFLFKADKSNKTKYIAPLVISILTILVMFFVPFLFTVAE